MNVVLDRVAEKQAAFKGHPLFSCLGDELTVEEALHFTPLMTFWVMGFQDILRLNEQAMVDPTLKKMARHHRVEDSGHNLWFLEDIAKVASGPPDLRTLFGRSHANVRDCTYALVAEVYKATEDAERIALLYSLEATGHLFFGKVAELVDKKSGPIKLKYFSSFHLKIEQAHQVFEDKMNGELRAVKLSDAAQTKALALIDRAFATFDTMFNTWTQDLLSVRHEKAAPRLQQRAG